jgi:hypothetical protein
MSETPRRIQLSRAKGWRMPENTVKVDRSTRWGNPFTQVDAREIANAKFPQAFVVDCFRDWLAGDRQCWLGAESDRAAAEILSRLHDLRGKNLACWCKPGEPCHADVLLELANK